MSNFRTYGAVAVMIGCFVVIYPRFMHPIFLNVLGLRDTQKPHDQEAHTYPSGHKGHPHERGPRGEAEEMRKHMRHGPHPGMRAAAEMQRQHGQQGSGRGMMGVVLPMYALGIVLYLAYTLYKVFNKSHAKDNAYSSSGSGRYARDKYRERDRLGFPKDIDSNQDIRNFLHDQQHRENLEDLLTRVDDKNVSADEMRVLQKRLEETEAQMTRILSAMHAVNANVDNLKTSEADPNEGKDEGKETQEESQPDDPLKDTEKVVDKDTETGAANDEQHTKDDKMNEDNVKAENEDGIVNEDPNVEDENDNIEEAVDELIEERKDDDDDNERNVRQRTVKSNEQ